MRELEKPASTPIAQASRLEGRVSTGKKPSANAGSHAVDVAAYSSEAKNGTASATAESSQAPKVATAALTSGESKRAAFAGRGSRPLINRRSCRAAAMRSEERRVG